ncbi:MAG: ParA family protein [Acidimicrobiia bacterium]|nr:ParA family protein [Acidimicrobiia bacterium]
MAAIVLASYSSKGGVGKTAAAVNLAHVAAEQGWRTLVWDLDPQAAATFYFRVKPKVKGGGRALIRQKRPLDDVVKGTDFEGLDLVPADFSYRNLDLVLDDTKKPLRRLAKVLKPIARDYDVVLLDCPPSISLASESVFEAANALMVPVIPTTLSVRTLEQLDDFLADATSPPRLMPFFSMVDGRKRLHRDVMEALRASRTDLLTTTVPATADVERMGLHRTPVTAQAPRSRAAAAYRDLWAEVIATCRADR